MKTNLIFFFLLLFFVSCEYEPDKTFSRELDENIDPPKLTIIGHQPEDPIILTHDTSLVFKFSATKIIKKIAFVVDDNSINQLITKDGIEGHIHELLQGRFVIDIVIYTEVGTTSIVDKIGAEAYRFDTRWVITSNGRYNPNIKASITNENSEIEIRLVKSN